jgi:hypothetical protein
LPPPKLEAERGLAAPKCADAPEGAEADEGGRREY